MTVLPRMEIQLRFFMLDLTAEQHDDFPPGCNVRIDEVPVALPVGYLLHCSFYSIILLFISTKFLDFIFLL